MMHTKEKSNKTVVITGASSGIGQACAEIYAQHGYSLILGARRFEKISSYRDILMTRFGVDILCAELDVRVEKSIQNFLQESLKNFPKIDVLINNAGLALGRSPIVSAKDLEWETMIETNFLGLLRVTRAFLPQMISNNEGHVVNIGSVAGFQSYAGGAAYAGTKHAVRAISQALREELYGTSIRVTEIDPGLVETEFSLVRFAGDDKKAKDVYSGMTPLNAVDVAETIYFATSRPKHVNIDCMVIQPTDQISVGKVFRRDQGSPAN
jgi:3-hydroxy acid dehydrogenase/malonic semialdehyde reductase